MQFYQRTWRVLQCECDWESLITMQSLKPVQLLIAGIHWQPPPHLQSHHASSKLISITGIGHLAQLASPLLLLHRERVNGNGSSHWSICGQSVLIKLNPQDLTGSHRLLCKPSYDPHMKSMKLVILSRFISWVNSFSDISRKCILPNMIGAVTQSYSVKCTSC